MDGRRAESGTVETNDPRNFTGVIHSADSLLIATMSNTLKAVISREIMLPVPLGRLETV